MTKSPAPSNQKANNGFWKLDKRLLSQHGISFETKLDVYNIYLSSLLYEYKTWVTYRKHMKRLEQFHQLCLRRILSILQQIYVIYVHILQRAQSIGTGSLLLQSRSGENRYEDRIKSDRIPKQMNWLGGGEQRKSLNFITKIASIRPRKCKMTGKT